MKHWSRTRRISLIVHVLFVSVPFFASSISALLLWQALFNSWWLAAPMVVVIDVLALTGLILTIARIPSPFVPLRHVLPFISIIPLGRELYLLLQHNDDALAIAVTIVVTAIFTYIAWKCFGTIEALFIDPVEAARERVQQEMRQMRNDLEALHTRNIIMDEFMIERLQYRGTPIIEADTVRTTMTHDAPRLSDGDGASDTPHGTLDTPHGTLDTPHGTLDTPHGTLDTPHGTLDTDPMTLARSLRQQGMPWRDVAHAVQMSDATLRRKLKDDTEGATS